MPLPVRAREDLDSHALTPPSAGAGSMASQSFT